MSELSSILEAIKGTGIAATPVFALLWWFEQRKVTALAERLVANTTALTVLTVTVNSLFQAMLARKEAS